MKPASSISADPRKIRIEPTVQAMLIPRSKLVRPTWPEIASRCGQQKMRPDRRVLPESCIVMLHHPLHAVAEVRRVITPIRPEPILR